MPTTTEEELKGLTKEKLRRSTWESVNIVQNLLPHDTEVVAKVYNTSAQLTSKNWPMTREAQEKDYCSAFSGLLNTTLQAARAALGTRSGSLYKSLSFSTYDRATKDGVDGPHVLNPSLVGCYRKITRSKKVSWHAICIPVEVKKCWPDTVVQATAYARCMFAASSGRQYALVIALKYISSEVRFLFFHRAGLTSSPAFNLKHNDGWMNFIGAVVGLASVNDRFSCGMDHSFDNSQIALPLGSCWKVDGWLCVGNGICGRATQVVRVSQISQVEEPKTACIKRRQPSPVTHSVKQAGGCGQKAASDSKETAEVVNSQKVDSNADPEVNVERIQRKPENNALMCFDEMLSLYSRDIPSSLVVKDAWPSVSQNNEKAMYEAAQGLFGVPEVLASYEVKGPDGNPHLTKRFLPAPREYWNIWSSAQYPATTEAATVLEPEDRVHFRHLFKTEGRDLLDAASPHELLEGILHAMIGYLNYFETGYMHRDVSLGNVLLLKQRSNCPAFTHIDIVSDKTECIGVLIDGDHAINWRESDCMQSAHPSGTLPFMSMRMVEIWLFKSPYHHTAIDDLESFLWLAVCCTFCIIENKGQLNVREAFEFRILCSTDIREHYTARPGVLGWLADASTPHPLLALFRPLLLQWQSISKTGAQEISDLLETTTSPENDALRDLTHKYFREYLTQGFSYLADFPQSWDVLSRKE